MDTTASATQKYRDRFSVAEQWRTDLIARVQRDGYVRMPDGHRYTKYEATQEWFLEWCAKFISQNQSNQLANYHNIIRKIGQRIARRAGNQSVNAFIQGSCATIAKRSQLRVDEMIAREGFRARFMIPIHDELVWSVHRKDTTAFIEKAREVMIDHPDLFQKCKLDASPSVGLTLEPWHEKEARTGQVELYELPKAIVGNEWADKRADAKRIEQVLDWLFEHRKAA